MCIVGSQFARPKETPSCHVGEVEGFLETEAVVGRAEAIHYIIFAETILLHDAFVIVAEYSVIFIQRYITYSSSAVLSAEMGKIDFSVLQCLHDEISIGIIADAAEKRNGHSQFGRVNSGIHRPAADKWFSALKIGIKVNTAASETNQTLHVQPPSFLIYLLY